ncbi:MAG: VOC family protein [Pirellulaceae bacterium]|nr:VOC family protein [Pirellulaceae bacterium]
MRVMVLVKASPSSEAGTLPSEELMLAMGQFNQELVEAGVMKAGEGLKPSSTGYRVHFSGKNRTVTDGPFAETKELIAGFWIWEVQSVEEAIHWVKRCPNPMPDESDIEIRPIYEMTDFAENDPFGEVAKQEQMVLQKLSTQSSRITPYLFFSGRCEEALDFYQHALGAKIGMVMRFDESPSPPPEGMLQPGFEKKIMHADFTVGRMQIMASDGCDDKSKFEGFRLALSLPTEADARRAFDALAEGGAIDMPLTATFWSPCYGMVTDKFNVGWMVMVTADGQ